MDVAVIDPHGRRENIRPVVTKRSETTWHVEYTPKEEGQHSVVVNLAGKPIQASPFPVMVASGKCFAHIYVTLIHLLYHFDSVFTFVLEFLICMLNFLFGVCCNKS